MGKRNNKFIIEEEFATTNIDERKYVLEELISRIIREESKMMAYYAPITK